jgi:hypothetical protein
MKIFLTLATVFALDSAKAVNITFINKSGDKARIAELSNKCTDRIISKEKPVHLKNGEKFVVRDVIPIIHTFAVCGSGYCSSSAIGLKKGVKEYTIEIVLNDGLIEGKAIPEHWHEANRECPK